MPDICPVCDKPLLQEDYTHDNIDILRGRPVHVVCPGTGNTDG